MGEYGEDRMFFVFLILILLLMSGDLGMNY